MTLGSSVAYVTGAALQEMGLPAGTATVLAAIVSGGITYSAGRYFLKDEAGKVIAEYTQDELEKVVKGEMDNVIPDVSAVKGSVEDLVEGVKYSPINPCDEISQEVAESFNGATFTKRILPEDTVM